MSRHAPYMQAGASRVIREAIRAQTGYRKVSNMQLAKLRVLCPTCGAPMERDGGPRLDAFWLCDESRQPPHWIWRSARERRRWHRATIQHIRRDKSAARMAERDKRRGAQKS